MMFDRKARIIPGHLWVVTTNFFVMSLLLSWLVGMGQRSYRIPAIVLIVVVFAFINTDWLGWFRLNRYVAYLGMILGALLAIREFFYGRSLDQLFSVANLLVYVQVPIMLQKKDQRLFDHWAIFLMLELIVAALLNENASFLLLLIPVLIVGCSTMVALATYSSVQQNGTSGPESAGLLPSLLRWLGRSESIWSRSSGIKMLSAKPKSGDKYYAGLLGWRSSVPFGMTIVSFAVIYFFALPRLHTGAYEGLGKTKTLVGFSGSVSLDDIAELMSNDEIALRVSMTDVNSRQYQPIEPPYIRGTVLHDYDNFGNWKAVDQNGSEERWQIQKLIDARDSRSELNRLHEQITVTVTEQTVLGATEFSIPPFFHAENVPGQRYAPRDWRLIDTSSDRKSRNKRRYAFDTFAFYQGKQVPFLVEPSDTILLSDKTESDNDYFKQQRRRLMEIDRRRFPKTLATVRSVLSEKGKMSQFEKALLLEEHLATSGEYKYSLLPAYDRSSRADPIEDFVGRHKTGHCQFFASALAIMLRSEQIPTRLVLGFRPSEYNEFGRFFAVRQNHAHTWVEAWIPVDQLTGTSVNIPPWVTTGAWIRLDPTPPGEGSNAGGSLRSARGQTFDAMDQLFKDYVMDMDSSRQSGVISMFGSAGNGFFGNTVRSMERMFLQLQNNSLEGNSVQTGPWFSWQSGLGGIAASALIIVVIACRNRLAALFGIRLFRGSKMLKNESRFALPIFFKRLQTSLGKLGLHRAASQTPREFAFSTQNWLDQHQFLKFADGNKLGRPLPMAEIMEDFYSLRYGELVELESVKLDDILRTIVAIETFASTKRR